MVEIINSREGSFQPPALDEYVTIQLDSIGKDIPDKWSFRRVIESVLFHTDNDHSPNVKTTIIRNYVDNNLETTSITLTTSTKVNDMSKACDRLIDAVVTILGAGEDLKLVIREEKEKFLDEQRSLRDRLDSFKLSLENSLKSMPHIVPAVFTRTDGQMVFFNGTPGVEEEHL